MPVRNNSLEIEQEEKWQENVARKIARQHVPVTLRGVYDVDDGFNTALARIKRERANNKPRYYQSKAARNAIIDDVRKLIGRTGKKLAVSIPSTSLDNTEGNGWIEAMTDPTSNHEMETIENDDIVEDTLRVLPEPHRSNFRSVIINGNTVESVSYKTGQTILNINKTIATSIPLLKNRYSELIT